MSFLGERGERKMNMPWFILKNDLTSIYHGSVKSWLCGYRYLCYIDLLKTKMNLLLDVALTNTVLL